jgi:hypothetical protein
MNELIALFVGISVVPAAQIHPHPAAQCARPHVDACAATGDHDYAITSDPSIYNAPDGNDIIMG